MGDLTGLWHWLVEHWKLWGVPAIAGTLAVAVRFYYDIAEKHAQKRKRKIEEEKESLGQLLRIFADTAKQKEKTSSLIFPEGVLREALTQGGFDEKRIFAVLAYLEDKGPARKAKLPGHWYID